MGFLCPYVPHPVALALEKKKAMISSVQYVPHPVALAPSKRPCPPLLPCSLLLCRDIVVQERLEHGDGQKDHVDGERQVPVQAGLEEEAKD